MKRVAMVAGLALALCGAAPEVRAETFTSEKFLKWPAESQASYFRTSIGMAAIIASQRGNGYGRCVSDWYFGSPEGRHTALREAMRKNSSFHPQAVILAILQKACGSFY